MPADLVLTLADHLGVFVFALSGGIVAVRKEMDLFGVVVLAFLPAVGGGTLRDVILDQPVFWLSDPLTLFLGVLGGLAAFSFYPWIKTFKPLRWADAFGLALFSVTGAAKAAIIGHNMVVIIIMGTITATAGGLLRDVVANEEPILLREDIYATAAMFGALVFALMAMAAIPQSLALAGGFVAAFGLRAAAILFGLSLPKSRP